MAVWDLGPKRWEVVAAAAEIDEDTGAWMIDLSLMPESFWTTVNATDGRDIRVTSSDGDTQLPCHIIGFVDSGTTGVGWLRVGGSVSASADTSIYIYAGDAGATMPARDSTYGSEAAYDANVAAAWWFDGGSLVDSTAAGITLTNNNGATATTGPVTGLAAYEFSAASSRYLNTTSPPITGLPGMIEFWEYATADTIEMSPVTLGNSASNSQNVLAEYDRGNISPKKTQGYVIGGGGTNASPSITEHPYNQWNHISVARDAVSGTTTLNRNGTVATNTTNIGSEPTYNRLSIGAMQRNTVALYFTGKVGPVFVHNTVRSTNYNATFRNMILNPSSVMTVGTMEEAPAGGETDWLEFTSASGTGWANPTQALTSLANAATDDIPELEFSAPLVLTNLNGAAAEVAGKPITGMAFEIVGTGQTGSRELIDGVLRAVIGGAAAGSNFAIATQWTNSALVTRVYGGAGNLLGNTGIDSDDITASNFGITMTFESVGAGSALMSIYRVRVKFWYETDDPDATASGAVVFDGLDVSGTAVADAEAAGAVEFDGLIVAGAANSAHNASGAVVFAALKLTGAARADVESSGAVVFEGLVVTGVAAPPVIASGDIVFSGLTVAGSSQSDANPAGAVVFSGLTIQGTAGGPGENAAGAVVFDGLIVAGDAFTPGVAGITTDSLRWYLTGADAPELSQRDQAASLGGYRSNLPVRSLTWDMRDPMVGIEILEIGGGNGAGSGLLQAPTEDTITWTPPGGAEGSAVALANGAEVTLYGFDNAGWIRVRRRSEIPLVGSHPVKCVDIFNNVIGFGNVASADAIAGAVYYRAVMGVNTFAGAMVNIRLWLDAAANPGLAIAYEAVVAGAIQTIADENTAPTGLTWNSGNTAETGLQLPPIAAGGAFGLWLRRTIAADTDPAPTLLNHIHVRFSDIITTLSDALRGRYRIARADYVTYGLWLGQDAEPDLDGEPDELFASAPHTTTLSLDGGHTYNAVVRRRNKWGLWSQNADSEPIVLDGDGNQDFTPPSAPGNVVITQNGDNNVIVGAIYEPAPDGDIRAHLFVVWITSDYTVPDPADAPTGYKLMSAVPPGFGRRTAIEVMKFVDTAELLDGTPVQALVRSRRLAQGDGTVFSPDTTQLPATGAGSIVVATELSDWDATGYMQILTFSGALQEIVEYSALVVGAGISTFTVDAGGRALMGTTASATTANNVIYPITPVDSTNTEPATGLIDGLAPARPWGELLFGQQAAQEQAPIAGPDGATEQYIDEGDNIYLLLGEGWCELWMDTVLVWKVFQDGNASAANRLYIPSEWDLITASVSGAGVGVFEADGPDDLYVCAGEIRRVHIDAAAMTITALEISTLGGLPEAAPQSASWEQYAGSLLQSWDPSRADYRPYAQLTSAGRFTSQWAIDNSLTQAEVAAL